MTSPNSIYQAVLVVMRLMTVSHTSTFGGYEISREITSVLFSIPWVKNQACSRHSGNYNTSWEDGLVSKLPSTQTEDLCVVPSVCMPGLAYTCNPGAGWDADRRIPGGVGGADRRIPGRKGGRQEDPWGKGAYRRIPRGRGQTGGSLGFTSQPAWLNQ